MGKNSKRERFEKVAANRVQKILDSLESLSKCSNKNNYQYDASDISKMINTIRKKVVFLESQFKERLKNNKESFKF